ncbi:nucleoside transporter, NupC family [Chromobacterium violaceum]|uniref:Nucleoside transporter, NupC family n=1 Tax=Chromobacterium violaceum TaxID=536 RepID=A0A3S4HQV8_CHRVL|nr:nucleoside transporter, NupC family [Chromobacterium violaceum]
MTRSELACIMIAGMSTLSGGVLAAYVAFLGGSDTAEQARFATYLLTASCMNAAGAVVFCKIMFPETSPRRCPAASCSRPGKRARVISSARW